MAEKTEVIRTLSPKDEMFEGNEAHYLGVGESALECIRRSLAAAEVPEHRVRRILDLPCGYGRVLRYLRAEFPEAEITACDLQHEGVDFCAQTFGATPVYSHWDPAKIPLPDDWFDLIWVGSLLPHVDAEHWDAFLRLFRRVVRPGGGLVFSTPRRKTFPTTALRTFHS